MFQYFPDDVLVDVTHGTNKLGFNIFSFMIHDAFGNKGQCAQVR